MSAADHDRFEELDAGRVLGDLSAEESREWEELRAKLGATADHGLDLAAASITSMFATEREESLPAGLAERLKKNIPAESPTAEDNIIRPDLWKRLTGGEAGWAVAALFAALLVATVLTRNLETTPPSAAVAKQELLDSDTELVSTTFAGQGNYDSMTGNVVWSDDRQEGYMTLTLPANDPTQAQYQLWIVDPERDEAPVDGGVFDIPAGGGEVIVPIDAKLAVDDPTLFVITLEQPGGVVKSKQEVVVAVAQS